jgi:hypothetical protein
MTTRPPPARRLVGETALACGLLAVVVGGLWVVLTPEVPLVVFSGEGLLGESAGRLLFAQDGWFGILGVLAGVLVGVVLWARHGAAHPVAAPICYAAFGLGGSVVAWQLGRLLGPPERPDLAGVEDLTEIPAPLDLHALGVLLLWPLASVLVVTLTVLLTPDAEQVPAAEPGLVGAPGSDLIGTSPPVGPDELPAQPPVTPAPGVPPGRPPLP